MKRFILVSLMVMLLLGFKGYHKSYFVVDRIVGNQVVALMGDDEIVAYMPIFKGAVEGGIYKMRGNNIKRDYKEELNRKNRLQKLLEINGGN